MDVRVILAVAFTMFAAGCLRGAQLADDEYVTWEGRVMTRDQIDAQRKCGVT
ncbi:hypothetical protein [Streptomyces sp. NPDC055709]